MHITLIAAIEQSNGIGLNNTLPWRLKSDLKHFKTYTLGKTMVMGTNTLKSFPKPLPGRKTILLSRCKSLLERFTDQIDYAACVSDVLVRSDLGEELIIAGGAQVYESFLPYATRLIITHVHADVVSDTYFPTIDNTWTLVDSHYTSADTDNEYGFTVCRYERQLEK